MKPLAVLGFFTGDLLAAGVFAGADHVAHHSDALGAFAEVTILVCLCVFGALTGQGAARR